MERRRRGPLPFPRLLLLDILQERMYSSVEHLGEQVSEKKADVLQGTLDMLILKTIALEPMHGYGIAMRIQQVSKDVLQIQQGSLYPALRRLERRGWITAEWGESENNRRARFYNLTKEGRKRLGEEKREWERLAEAVTRVLQTD